MFSDIKNRIKVIKTGKFAFFEGLLQSSFILELSHGRAQVHSLHQVPLPSKYVQLEAQKTHVDQFMGPGTVSLSRYAHT